jgi:hypothetical protein
LFTNVTGSAIVQADLTQSTYNSIADAGVDQTVVAVTGDNFITITLGADAVFAPQSALTSGSINLKSFTVTGGSDAAGSGVTDASGLMLPKGDSIELWAGPSNVVYAICATGQSASLRVLELS